MNLKGWIFLSTIQKIHPTSHQLKLNHFDEKIHLPCKASIGVDPEFGVPCTLNSLQEKWFDIKGWNELELEDLKRLTGLKLWLHQSSLSLPLWSSFLDLTLVDMQDEIIGKTFRFSFGKNQTFLIVKTKLQTIDLPLVSEQFEVCYQGDNIKKITCKISKNDLEDIYGEL